MKANAKLSSALFGFASGPSDRSLISDQCVQRWKMLWGQGGGEGDWPQQGGKMSKVNSKDREDLAEQGKGGG